MVNYRGINKMLSSENIEQLEAILEVSLPGSYSKFLMTEGYGEVYYNSFNRSIVINGINDSVSEAIDEILNIEQITEYWTNWSEYDLFTDAKVIPFASTLGATFVGIGYVKENYGKIYVVDFDFGATFQANTLEEFFLQLHYDPMPS